MNVVTPIQELPSIGGTRIFVKREDLLPFSFGGNKVRIAASFFEDMARRGCDCLVGYGNARSNLCRVLSAMAQKKGVPCVIVSPDDEDGTRTETFNSRLVRACGARIVSCPKNKVRETVEAVLAECRAAGLTPYYIYGNADGRGNEAVSAEAYIRAAAEIAAQEEALGVSFSRIYFASGTGMTQAGLIAGALLQKKDWEIVGISIARDETRCKAAVRDRVRAALDAAGLCELPVPEPVVKDAYLLEGYGRWNGAVADTIRRLYGTQGIPLDPTYSGKAFWGMTEELKKDPPAGPVLFLHTGGGPLFFDFLLTEA